MRLSVPAPVPAPRNPFLTGKRLPLVVGHRGVPLLHQENSLAGFRRAVELGIPAVECDVRLTADGVPVLFHDHEVGRLTSGHGRVAEMTWDQLCQLRIRRDLPMGIDPSGTPVTLRYAREEPIALLAEVLDELAGKVAINVELKIALPRWWHTDVGTRTAAAIAAAGVEDSVIVTSFDPRRLAAASRGHPRLVCGFCFDDTMLDFAQPLFARLPRGPFHPRTVLERILGTHLVGHLLGTRAVGADHTIISERSVGALHKRGVAVGTHTLFPIGSTGKPIDPRASTVDEVKRLVGLRVDWIESDDPERLMSHVA